MTPATRTSTRVDPRVQPIPTHRTPLWRSGGPIMGRRYIYPPPPVRSRSTKISLTLCALVVLYFAWQFQR